MSKQIVSLLIGITIALVAALASAADGKPDMTAVVMLLLDDDDTPDPVDPPIDPPVDPAISAEQAWDPARVQRESGASVGARTPPADALQVGAGQAYASVHEALRAASTGDTIVVHAGLYREALTEGDSPDLGGYIGKRVTIQAAPGTRPVFTGADRFRQWQAYESGLWFTEFDSPFPAPGPDTIAPDQVASTHPLAGNLEQVFIDGEVLTQTGSRDATRGSERRFFYDAIAKRIYVGTNPQGRRVEISTRRRAAYLNAPGLTVRGLHFTRFSPDYIDGRGAVVVTQPGVVLEDVTVTNSAAIGIVIGADDVRLRRVTARWNGALGVQVNRSNNLRVEFSRIDNNNIESFDYKDCGGGQNCILAGMKIAQSRNVVVRYSAFRDNRSTGLWCDLDCADVVIVGNLITGNSKHGIYFEVSHNATIVSNVIAHQIASDAAGVKVSGSANVVLHRNTFVNNTTQVIASSDPRNLWPVAGSDISNLDVRANVFAEPRRANRRNRQLVLDPFNFSGPAPEQRIARYYRNAYLLTPRRDDGLPARFRWTGNSVYSSPEEFSIATNYRYATGFEVLRADDPASYLRDVGNGDYRIQPNLPGFDYSGGVSVPGNAIGNDRLFQAVVSGAEQVAGFGAVFLP